MIALRSGPYRAAVNPHGASIAELSFDRRDILLAQDGQGGPPLFRGAVLAPWPNRVHDGLYELGGRSYQLTVNDPERNAALHGLVYDQDWEVVERSTDRAVLTVSVDPQHRYPSALSLRISYQLGEDGLTVTLRATNTGGRTAPYGCGFHPYFTSGPDPVDDVEVRIEAARHLDVTPDRMLPVGLSDVPGTAYDFTGGRPVGDQVLDEAYTGVGRVCLGTRSVRAIEVWRDDRLGWLQAFTPPDRDAIALEPCSCPEDAYRSGEDLVLLGPGEVHTATWGVTVRPGGG